MSCQANMVPRNVLFVCTGNAARSVMGAALMRAAVAEDRGDQAPGHQLLGAPIVVTSAGTHSIPNLPMSVRTKGALDAVGVADLDHRSAQLDASLADPADMVVVFEPMHVKWIRKHLPDSASQTASLARFAQGLRPGSLDDLDARITELDLANQDFEAWEEVIDPAGGDLPDFVAAAERIAGLVAQLAPKLHNA